MVLSKISTNLKYSELANDGDDDDRIQSESDDDSEENGQAVHSLLGGQEMLSPASHRVKSKKLKSQWEIIREILIETCPTLLFTVVGMVFAGELLDRISEWPAFVRVDELLILVPILINLKGNVEMNLSSRLSTAANIGKLDTWKARRKLVSGNLWLLQVQSLVVSSVAAILSYILGVLWPPDSWVPSQRSSIIEFMIVLSSSMWAASLSAVILGVFLSALIIVCRYLRLDPDNIAAPIAACLGDLLTMSILSIVASFLMNHTAASFPIVLALILFLFTGISVVMTLKNSHVRPSLFEGWSPLFGAMIISSCAGMVLDQFVSKYEGFGMMSIVIGGLPGSVGSIFVSRLSTALHAARASRANTDSDLLPHERPLLVGGTLLAVSLPIAIIYLFGVWAVGWMSLPPLFIMLFVVFFCLTSALSLLAAYGLTQFFWSWGLDPDAYCLPIQSSLVDLIGPALLVVCYEVAQAAGGKVTARPHPHQQ